MKIEEIYFLIRVGTWGPDDLINHIAQLTAEAYAEGQNDARHDDYSANQADCDDAYNRGYDHGHNEGYREGYADGSREASYSQDDSRW